MNHPAYQVPPALILLPAEGGKIKVYTCAIKYHTSFQILYSVVVEEETEAHQPPGPLFASPRLSLLSPSLQNELQSAFCWGRVSGAHLVACGGEGQSGSRAGNGVGGAEGGVWLEEQLLGGGGGGQH